MKILIGASKIAKEYILNSNEEIACYDNDRRKWGKDIVDGNKIINFERLQQLIKNTNYEIIIATKCESALYFVNDICKDSQHKVSRLINGILYPLDLKKIPVYSIDRETDEKIKLDGYKKIRDFYKENGIWEAYEHACLFIEMKEESLLMPEVGGIELTNYCNLSCPNCPTPNCKRKKGYMEGNIFEECFKYITPSIKDRFSLHGLGEPLLHPNFLEYLERVINIGRPVIVSTNGLLLSEDIIERLFSIMNKINNCMIYVSFHSNKSVQNWNNCTEWIKKNPENKVELYGQILEHNSKQALNWLGEIGITEPSCNPYIRFITSHSFAGNVESRRQLYTDIEVKNRFRNCYYNLNNVVNVAWDGRLKTCCLDSELTGEIGNIYNIKGIKLGYEPYELCRNCDPDWTSNYQ